MMQSSKQSFREIPETFSDVGGKVTEVFVPSDRDTHAEADGEYVSEVDRWSADWCECADGYSDLRGGPYGGVGGPGVVLGFGACCGVRPWAAAFCSSTGRVLKAPMA